MTILVELDEAECSALLRSNHTGRVAFVSGDRPLVLPVNYVIHGDLIVFRTAPGRKLAEVPMRHVAFEVDGATAEGSWSVLAQGFAREMTDVLGETADRAGRCRSRWKRRANATLGSRSPSASSRGGGSNLVPTPRRADDGDRAVSVGEHLEAGGAEDQLDQPTPAV